MYSSFSPVCACVFVCAGNETHSQYIEPPVIPGHEFIGEVVRLGPGSIHPHSGWSSDN